MSSLIGISSVIFTNRKRTKVGEDGKKTTISREIKDPELELDLATYLSAIMVFVIGLVGAYLVFGKISDMFEYGWIAPWGAAVLGVISSVAVGKITEYYTSIKHRPVQKLKEMAFEGDSFVVTMGDAIGQRSVLLPILVIGVSMMISFKLCGSYGIAIAGLGMLSFVGTTVSIDAFGPISDNAGGIAESCHLEPGVRRITDKLDAVGNTTAAIGKGNAIGSACFATVAFIISYFGSFDTSNIDPLEMIIYLMIGLLIGCGLVKFFSALLTTNTITSAKDLADAGEEQLRIPGIIEGTKRPDYNGIVDLGTSNSIKRMLLPSILALLAPFIFGHTFGQIFMLGILLGGTGMAVGLAIYNGNSGGAFDNAKKSIEEDLSIDPDNEALIRAHKASVTGDTVGDTRKDVVCVDLDIFIKTMSTVSNTLVHNFTAFHLF